ncbi:galectin-12 isoform X7 [Mustela erminea]|uniref:galectin-12 isoform X7 n=1 Tax=Mustela erminea TaxID=36723 RepID=UPI001386FFF3|nr:galectin-12 isoform X7 [Mustela erminea]
MSPGEKLDPLPDPFILQPPIFHPVSVNGQHFLHYRYRLPLSRVDTLGIFGDILVEAIGFLNISPFAEGGSEYPVGYPLLLKSPSLVSNLPPGSPCGGVVPRKHAPPQLHTEPAGRGCSRARDAPGFLHRQNSGLDLALGVQEADLSPLPLLSTAILRGAAPVPGGRAEAGAQRAGPGRHQPPAAEPGATAGGPGQWQCPALLRPLLRSEPGTPPGKGRARPGTPCCSSALHPSLNRVPVTTTRVCRGFGSHSRGKAPTTRGPLPQEPGPWFSPPAGPRQGGVGAAS